VRGLNVCRRDTAGFRAVRVCPAKSRVAEENIYVRLRPKPAGGDGDDGEVSYGIVAIFSTVTGRTVPDPKTRRATTQVPRWMLEHAPQPPPGEEDETAGVTAQDSDELAATSDEYVASEPETPPPTKRRRGRPPKNPQVTPSSRPPRSAKRVQYHDSDEDDENDMEDVLSDVNEPEVALMLRVRCPRKLCSLCLLFSQVVSHPAGDPKPRDGDPESPGDIPEALGENPETLDDNPETLGENPETLDG
jgi:hypothetical protein